MEYVRAGLLAPRYTHAAPLLSVSTGHKAPASGIYRGGCCSREIALSKGETAPPCSKCRHAIIWTMVRATR